MTIHHRTATGREAAADMLRDAARALPYSTLLDVIGEILEGRPDTDPDRLDQHANSAGLLAHMRAIGK